ncbi:Cytochrome P450 [Paraburkholderia steynii]|uniref:Cytochrome P450 n=1 Tax=Paraburkholderia steynii TaxID=1245441 RepID=A0A7Z7BHA2_9BURK|nr:cytochrome P450 [Paraburkholderia steynii]SDJ22888.1 Cytochrome P450 [Paraburkholderia steynii]
MQVPFSLLHRDQYRWHAPESFDPSRFADSESVRVCIGIQLAMLEAKSVLAWLTRDNVIVPGDGPSAVYPVCGAELAFAFAGFRISAR